MADGTLQILGLGTSAVPLDYTASGDQALDLVAVNADYDGGAASVDWQPVVEIISTAGHVMARGVGPTITAGDSASVTFAPFLRSATSSTPPPGGGIQFDTHPQVGDWLEVTTTGAGPSFVGIYLQETSGDGIVLEAVGGVYLLDNGVTLQWTGGGTLGTLSSNHLKVTGSTDLELHSNLAQTYTSRTFHFIGDGSGSDTFQVGVNGGINLTGGLAGFQGQLAVNTDGSVQMDTAAAQIKVDTAGNIILTPLPIVDPGVSGAVWNNGGVLNVSP
jgi:hypothetical protein